MKKIIFGALVAVVLAFDTANAAARVEEEVLVLSSSESDNDFEYLRWIRPVPSSRGRHTTTPVLDEAPPVHPVVVRIEHDGRATVIPVVEVREDVVVEPVAAPAPAVPPVLLPSTDASIKEQEKNLSE